MQREQIIYCALVLDQLQLFTGILKLNYKVLVLCKQSAVSENNAIRVGRKRRWKMKNIIPNRDEIRLYLKIR